MEAATQLVFDIQAFSSIMALVVFALAVIACMKAIINLCHGEFVRLSDYTFYVFYSSVPRNAVALSDARMGYRDHRHHADWRSELNAD